MRMTVGSGAILLALGCCIAAPAVFVIDEDHLGAAIGIFSATANDFASKSGVARELTLSDEQRAQIHAAVLKIADAPTADVAAPEPMQAVPETVALMDLPANVISEVPLVKGYKFVKLDDWILVVSPANRMVVAEIPRYRLLLQ
jgi:hypothetical protein